MEIISKAFAIPILTAILSTKNYIDAVRRIGIANALEFIFILASLELYLQPVSILFDP